MLRRLKGSVLSEIFLLALPTMLEQLMQTAVQYIDTAMVGSLGTDATAAVGATTTIGWLTGSSISALGVGFLAYISQNKGAGRAEQVRRASGQAVIVAVTVGVIFTLLSLAISPFIPKLMRVDEGISDITAKYFFILYTPMLARAFIIIFGSLLRAVGDSKTPMLVGVAVNIINVLLNFLFIYPERELMLFGKSITVPGLDMGVTGAAAASAASFAVGGVLISLALMRNRELSPGRALLRPDKAVLESCLRIALPNMLQRFGTSLGYVVFAAMINSLGEVATAAHTIANTVESAFYIPGYGMQAAAATLTGNAVGQGNKEKENSLKKMLVLSEVFLMLASGTLLFIFAEGMVALFSEDAKVILLGSRVLRMVALSEPFYGVSIIIEGMFQGRGDTKTPFLYNIIGMWGIRIAGTFICLRFFSTGLVSAWACMIVHNLFLFLCFVLVNRRTRDKENKI